MNDWRDFLTIDPALAYYKRDMATKSSSEVHALAFYRRVLADVIACNIETLPNAGRMSYSEKIAIVLRNGWLDDISEQVEQLAAGTRNGSPQSLKSAVNSLAAHWRAQ